MNKLNSSPELSINEMQEIQAGKTMQQAIGCTMVGLAAEMGTAFLGPGCIVVGCFAGIGCWLS